MHAMTTRRAARRIALATGLLAILVATPALAQERGRRHDPEEHLAKLQEELDLTDPQVEQIRAIFTEQHAKFEQLRDDEGDRESKHEAFRKLREETHERIAAVLTEEQRSRLEEIHAEYHERHGGRDGGPGHEGHAPKDRLENG
jgi:Spy/CpxP family protein refolding chaperone